MKKSLVVLTILVLVAGSVFADISGKVSASYTFALGTNKAGAVSNWGASAGYTKPGTGKVDASFTLDSQSAGLTGEGMPYVDLAVSAKIAGYYGYSSDHANTKSVKDLTKVTWTFKVAKFDIVGDGWKINLLNAKGAALDLAVSAIDSVKFNELTPEENEAFLTYANAFDYADGVTVTYKDFIVGVGVNAVDIRDSYAAISLEVATPEFTFDAVKVQAGAGFSQTGYVAAGTAKAEQVFFGTDAAARKITAVDGVTWQPLSVGASLNPLGATPYTAGIYLKKTAATPAVEGGVRLFGASVKVAYDADVKASVAVDLGKRSTDDKVKFDLAANLQVAPVTVDVYFSNEGATVTDAKDVENGGDPMDLGLENYLSAKAVVDLGAVVENVPVTLTFNAYDLLDKNPLGRGLDIEANTTAVKDFDITVGAYSIFRKALFTVGTEVVYTGIENLKLDAEVDYMFELKLFTLGVEAEYTAEKYTAKANASVITDFTSSLFEFGASVESDKIVNGATLKAALDGFGIGADVGENAVTAGALTLSCTVKF